MVLLQASRHNSAALVLVRRVLRAGGSSHGIWTETCHGISALQLQVDCDPWTANCTPSGAAHF